MPKKWRALAASAALIAAVVAVPSPALASCPPDAGYTWSGTTGSHRDMVPSVWGDGGVTISITLTIGSSASATVGGSLQTTESVLIASAQETISASITQTMTATVAYSGSWTVPSTASWGELHAGASSYSSHWAYGHYSPTCVWTVTSSGTANMPYHYPSFWHVVHN